MKSPILILAALLAILPGGCQDDSEQRWVTRMTPTVRLPLAPGRPGVAYLELPIPGDRGALVSVTSQRIGRIEMHESMSSGDMTSMRPLQRIPTQAGRDLVFMPGGRHLMLFDLDPTLQRGDSIELVFNFENAPPMRISATVVAGMGDES